jgi:protein-S-isoprenylcysteine O-methyltransferase Ste14
VSLFLKNLFCTVLGFGLVAGWVPLRWFEQHPHWPASWRWTHWVGLSGFLGGVTVSLCCIWLLASKGRGTLFFLLPPQRLVQRGLYAWVRNPMDLGLFAIVGGEALFFWSIHLGIYFVCLVCVVHLVVTLYEESALSYQFGAMYEDYKRTVPRWLPRKPRPALTTIAPFGARK